MNPEWDGKTQEWSFMTELKYRVYFSGPTAYEDMLNRMAEEWARGLRHLRVNPQEYQPAEEMAVA